MATSPSCLVTRRIHACALLLLGTTLSYSTCADASPSAYVGIALHRATFELDGDLVVAGFDGRDTALKLIGGYRFTERLAVEASYFDIGDGNGASAAEITALTVSAAGIWPVKKLDLYGRAGLSYWRTAIRHDQQPASRDSLADPFLGFGVSYEFGQLALRSDFDLLLLRTVDSLGGPPKGGGWVETISIGAVWRFR